VNILIDTNIFLWASGIDGFLSDEGVKLIQNKDNSVYVSAVSVWEISIKWSIGRLDLPENPPELIRNILERSEPEFIQLPVAFSDSYLVSQLPVGDHKDPFDRLLVAQALNRGFSLMTSDKKFKQYDIDTLLYFKK